VPINASTLSIFIITWVWFRARKDSNQTPESALCDRITIISEMGWKPRLWPTLFKLLLVIWTLITLELTVSSSLQGSRRGSNLKFYRLNMLLVKTMYHRLDTEAHRLWIIDPLLKTTVIYSIIHPKAFKKLRNRERKNGNNGRINLQPDPEKTQLVYRTQLVDLINNFNCLKTKSSLRLS
jgi:hypothetical protein